MTGIAWICAAALLCAGCAAAAKDKGHFTNLGPRITATTLIGTTFAKEPSGRELICTVMRGKPAKLLIFDLKSGELLHKLALVGADGAWNATTASDGSVYAGTDDNGHLYRYVPGEDRIADLGQVPPDKWVWDVCAGKDGEVFASTYAGCRIVRYRPGEGFKEVSNGPAAEHENYARSVTYDKVTGKIYVGVGTHAHLVEIDPKTGAKMELLPKEYTGQQWVYGVEVLGDRLFACVMNAGKSIVFNLRTREIETVLPHMTGQQVITKSPGDDRVWYVVNGHLWCYDMSRPKEEPKELVAVSDAIGMGWTHWNGSDYPGDTLVIFTQHAHRILYNPKTGKMNSMTFKTPAEPIVLQSFALGPDGKIWMGGYLSGGNATYDPATGKSEEHKGLSQAESMAVLGNSMYFGLYPGGRFAVYDLSRPWDTKQNNPRMLGNIEKQSRPFGALGIEELKKVYWGTVPEYGYLGGGIASYDPAEGKLEFYDKIVPDQSIMTLAYNHGLIVGGSSTYGGMGIPPSQKSAHLFLWDPNTKQVVFDTVPVEGAPSLTWVINGPDGNIWGLADGTLFVFDVAKREILYRQELMKVHREKDKAIWRGGMMLFHPSGQIYGTLDKKFFHYDPNTKQMTVLRKEESELLTMDREGNFYFRQKSDLWRFTP